MEGLKGVLRGMRAGFPDMHWSIEEQIAEGDKVVTRFEWTGTHRGEFLGVPATGRPVKVWGKKSQKEEAGRAFRRRSGRKGQEEEGNIKPAVLR